MTSNIPTTPNREPFDGPIVFAVLRDALARLYPEVQDARLIVDDAGINAGQIAFDARARARANWHNILTAALHQNRLDRLIQLVRNEYLDNPVLHSAYTNYRRLLDSGERLEVPTQRPDQLPALGDLISAQIGAHAQIIAVSKDITQVVYQGSGPPRMGHPFIVGA